MSEESGGLLRQVRVFGVFERRGRGSMRQKPLRPMSVEADAGFWVMGRIQRRGTQRVA